MRGNRVIGVALASALAGVLLLPSQGQAQYLDPGAGSVITQVVIALTIGMAAALKLYWGKISRLLSRRSKTDPKP